MHSLDGGEILGSAKAAAVEDAMLEVVFLQVHASAGLVVTQLTLVCHVHVTDIVHEQVPITVYLLLELWNRNRDRHGYVLAGDDHGLTSS